MEAEETGPGLGICASSGTTLEVAVARARPPAAISDTQVQDHRLMIRMLTALRSR